MDNSGTTPPARMLLADHGLKKVVMTTLGGNNEIVVMVRILHPDDVRRIMAALDDASVG